KKAKGRSLSPLPPAAHPRLGSGFLAIGEEIGPVSGSVSCRGLALEDDDRQVVLGTLACEKALDLADDPTADRLGVEALELAESPCQACLPELLATFVAGLGDSVRIEQQHVTDSHLDFPLSVLSHGEHAERVR